jgi:endonuclease G
MKLNRRSVALLALLAALLSPLKALALFEDCKDLFPGQLVPITSQAGRDLCFDSFAIYYSPQDKKPIYTIEKLNREQLLATHPRRSNQFYEEARLPFAERALLSDYRGSGYDRGHNAPAGDMSNERAMAQSFSLANMMPQARQNNQGIWAKNVEEPTRQYAKRAHGDIYVFTGSTGNQGSIGRGVTIPTHLFKLVYDPNKHLAWAYWIENTNEAQMSPPISYMDLVAKTGIDFQLPLINSKTQGEVTSKPTPSPRNTNKPLIGGWYPVFFDDYSAEKVGAIIKRIHEGKVADLQIQYDRNSELAQRIAAQIEAQTSLFVSPTQSSPPESPGVSYERNRVTVIVRSK